MATELANEILNQHSERIARNQTAVITAGQLLQYLEVNMVTQAATGSVRHQKVCHQHVRTGERASSRGDLESLPVGSIRFQRFIATV